MNKEYYLTLIYNEDKFEKCMPIFSNDIWKYYWDNIHLIKNIFILNRVIDYGLYNKFNLYDHNEYKKINKLQKILNYLSEQELYKFISNHYTKSEYVNVIIYLPINLIFLFASYYNIKEQVFHNLKYFNDELINQFLEDNIEPNNKIVELYYYELLLITSTFDLNLETFKKLINHKNITSDTIVLLINDYIYENDFYNILILIELFETNKWKNNCNYKYNKLYNFAKQNKFINIINVLEKYNKQESFLTKIKQFFIFNNYNG